jgi:hypothetical protein
MSEGTNRKGLSASSVIEAFLSSMSEPGEDDWVALIAEHPEFAGEIADAALVYGSVEHLSDSDTQASLDSQVFDAGVSRAISLVHEIPSALLADAQQKIASIQGPAIRAVAAEIGLVSAPALLSGVLVGSIEAPRQIVDALVKSLKASSIALSECFRRARQDAAVPAYKAEAAKPGVSIQPMSWEDAVRSLKLPADETEKLLIFKD